MYGIEMNHADAEGIHAPSQIPSREMWLGIPRRFLKGVSESLVNEARIQAVFSAPNETCQY